MRWNGDGVKGINTELRVRREREINRKIKAVHRVITKGKKDE